MANLPEDPKREEFDAITARLNSERPRLSAFELDQLKSRVLARASRRKSRMIRLTGQVRWIALGIGLVIAAGTTGGTIAAVTNSAPSGVAQNAGCTQYAAKINFRWHYSANGSSGSWSGTGSTNCGGTISLGPQAMEGDLKVAPGTTLKVGYDLTIPGNNTTVTFTVTNPKVTFNNVHCANKSTPTASSFTVTMPSQAFSISDSQWHPSGDQSSPLVYQGSIAVPDLCHGTTVELDQGGTFTASIT